MIKKMESKEYALGVDRMDKEVGALTYVSVVPVNLLESVSVALKMHMILWVLSLIRLEQ